MSLMEYFFLGVVIIFAQLCVPFVATFLSSYIPAYFKEKGKAKAIIEDLEKITSIVETIKHQNSLLLESRKEAQQLRMAAIDKRLQAHQEAFAHWRQLIMTVGTAEHREQINKSREWWANNCLYLEPDARSVFIEGCSFCELVLSSHDRTRDDVFNHLHATGEAIYKAVGLPRLSLEDEKEIARFKNKNS